MWPRCDRVPHLTAPAEGPPPAAALLRQGGRSAAVTLSGRERGRWVWEALAQYESVVFLLSAGAQLGEGPKRASCHVAVPPLGLAVIEVVETRREKISSWGLAVTAGFLCMQSEPSILLASVQKRPKHATLLDNISTG